MDTIQKSQPVMTKSKFLSPGGPAAGSQLSGMQRRERKEEWSGEWNQSDIQEVIRKLRHLK